MRFLRYITTTLCLVSYLNLIADQPTISPDPTSACCEPCPDSDCCYGIWLPEDPPLFRPFVADPRQITYSAGWRFNDQALDVTNVIDVSFFDSCALYRLCNAWPWGGQLQIEIEGAVWGTFDPLHNSSPLINADYYVGVPITYAVGPWSFRLRGYHISCHLGDEYVLNHLNDGGDYLFNHVNNGPRALKYDPQNKEHRKKIKHFHDREVYRRNPSAEFLDFYASYWPSDEIRVYAGIGVVVSQDKSFQCGRFYSQAGVELHMSQLGFINECQQLYGRPFYGMDFRFQSKQDKHINQTYVLGYEWGKLCGLQRVLRVFIEYHDGYSYEGQFAHFPTNYTSLRVSYGF